MGRPRMTYANVTATVALVLAAGGSAIAAGGGLVSGGGSIHACAPSAGGPLLVVPAGKSCPKRDVALRLNERGVHGPRGRRGAAGASGLQGAPGATGPVGPTYAAQLNAGTTFSASGATVVTSLQVTLPVAGRLYIRATGFHSSGTCVSAAGPCVLDFGLLIDGSPVPGVTPERFSLGSGSAGSDGPVEMSGLTGTLSAGTHTIALADNYNASLNHGTFNPLNAGADNITAIEIGS